MQIDVVVGILVAVYLPSVLAHERVVVGGVFTGLRRLHAHSNTASSSLLQWCAIGVVVAAVGTGSEGLNNRGVDVGAHVGHRIGVTEDSLGGLSFGNRHISTRHSVHGGGVVGALVASNAVGDHILLIGGVAAGLNDVAVGTSGPAISVVTQYLALAAVLHVDAKLNGAVGGQGAVNLLIVACNLCRGDAALALGIHHELGLVNVDVHRVALGILVAKDEVHLIGIFAWMSVAGHRCREVVVELDAVTIEGYTVGIVGEITCECGIRSVCTRLTVAIVAILEELLVLHCHGHCSIAVSHAGHSAHRDGIGVSAHSIAIGAGEGECALLQLLTSDV